MLRDAFLKACQGGWNLCVNTRIEIYATAALCATTAAFFSYQHEAAKRGQIPIAFSEIERPATANGTKPPPLTAFYAGLNDVVMEVFEASNISYLGTDNGDLGFAHQIAGRINSFYSFDSALSHYAPNMQAYANAALDSLAPITAAQNDIAPIINALDAAWNESHIDRYRTEWKTRTVCDSKGQNCRSESYSVEVYDYTDHYFRYNEQQGRLAEHLLNEFAAAHPAIRINEELVRTTRTSTMNEHAMRDSRRSMPGYTEPTPEQFLAMANIWASGSNYSLLTSPIYGSHAAVMTASSAWDRAAETARNRHYRTYMHTHSGPEEFQIAEKTQEMSYGLYRDAKRLTDGIKKAGTDMSVIVDAAREIAQATRYGQQSSKDLDTLRSQIVDTARTLYSANYAGGFDVYPSKWYMMGVWALLAGAMGAGIGFGADRFVAQRNEQLRRQPRAANDTSPTPH